MRIRMARVVALCSLVVLVVPWTPATAVEGTEANFAGAVASEAVRPPWGPLNSPIRPGSQFGDSCTYNWVFNDQASTSVYIGTAAHCTEAVGERASLGGFGQIGTVVYDSDVVGSDVDFSLIQIDGHLVGQTNPTMRGFAGPVGAVSPNALERGDIVDVYGYGIGVGLREETRARQGVLVNWTQNEYVADMPAVNGDSGAPLLHDETGRALGIISRYGFSAVPPSTDVGPMMPWIMSELAKAGFGHVRLATTT
ncbi:MAG: serine protease [Actinomycetota bacterium]|nr:serine protease [Actinomycetota bacterium]